MKEFSNLSLSLSLLGALVWSVNAAELGAKGEVRDTIRALALQSSYAWTSTPKAEPAAGSVRQGPTVGQAERNGFTYFRLTVGENTIEVALKGSRSAIKAEGDWESAEELPRDREWLARRLKSYQAPAVEAEELLGLAQFLKKEAGGVYSGDLTAQGVKNLLLLRSRTSGQTDGPRNTKGWVKFWVKDGLLVKYEFNVQGKVIGQDLQEHEVNRTTSVEIKNIGSTKVQVPDGALKKLM